MNQSVFLCRSVLYELCDCNADDFIKGFGIVTRARRTRRAEARGDERTEPAPANHVSVHVPSRSSRLIARGLMFFRNLFGVKYQPEFGAGDSH